MTLAAALLVSLGHHVEEAHPDGLEDDDLVARFTAVGGQHPPRRAGRRAVACTVLGAEDVEPLTWALAERAAAITADDYIEGLAALSRYRRRVEQWWHHESPWPVWTSC